MPDAPALHANPAASALQRIANALNCPVESLYGEAGGLDDMVSASELVRLWLAIETQVGRDRVLAYARAVLADQDAPPAKSTPG